MAAILFLEGVVGSYSLDDDNLLALAGRYVKKLKSKTINETFVFCRFPEDFIPDPDLLWWSGFDPETWKYLDDDKFLTNARKFFDDNKIKPNTPVICFDALQLQAALRNVGLVLPIHEPLGVRDYYMVLANRKLVPIIENPSLPDIADVLQISYDFPLDPMSRLGLVERVYKKVIELLAEPLTNGED